MLLAGGKKEEAKIKLFNGWNGMKLAFDER